MSESRIDALQQMVQSRPEDSRLRFGLAVEFLRAGRTQDAVEALRAYLSMAEDEGNAWGRLGAALTDLGEVEEARRAYEKGISSATQHGHDALVEEFREALESLT